MIAYSQHLDRWLKGSKNALPVMAKLQSEIEQTQRLLLNLSHERHQMRLRIAELRRELASIRARHSNREKPQLLLSPREGFLQ